ncbi:hypothetical protein H5410_019467 [Solanum commersonii]|uniref:Uncharacterized protein n=1 Tax=Solanum commersonii TaxID=4109 RepID=A0A9J5Z6C5_SOLCO|nr:hypothetical protein H5410_019467 [Solanum commersonii]
MILKRHTFHKFLLHPFCQKLSPLPQPQPEKIPVDAEEQPAEPSGSEIDPRYGIEKRRVPSGPNPLHH